MFLSYNKMNFENFPKKQEAKKPDLPSILMASFLSLASFATDPHEAEAAEIPASASWLDGMKIFKKAVYQDKKETAAFFVVGKDGKTNWLQQNVGKKTRAYLDFDKIHEQTKALPSQAEKVCVIHNHTLTGSEAIKLIDEKIALSTRSFNNSTISLPPSPQDIIASREFERIFGFDIGYKNSVFTVTDPSGIWYVKAATEADKDKFPETKKEVEEMFKHLRSWDNHKLYNFKGLTPEEMEILEAQREQAEQKIKRDSETISDYTKKSIHQKPKEEDYLALQKAFLTINTAIRFIPWEEVQNEPPCAGVDYKK